MPTSSTRRSRPPTRCSISRQQSACVTSSTIRSDRCAPTPAAPSTCSMRVRVHRRRVLLSPRRLRSTGSRPTLPWHEDDDRVLGATDVPRWSYATAKALDEHLALAHAAAGLPVTIVRYFNSYGPGSILAATDRWLPGSSARRSRESPSPCTATAPRPAASPTSPTRCGARCSRRGHRTLVGRVFNIGSDVETHARRPRPDDHRTDGVDVDDPAREPRVGTSATGSRTLRADGPTSRERAPSSGGSRRCRWTDGLRRTFEWWSTANR